MTKDTKVEHCKYKLFCLKIQSSHIFHESSMTKKGRNNYTKKLLKRYRVCKKQTQGVWVWSMLKCH